MLLLVAFLFFVIAICFSPDVRKDARFYQRTLVWLVFLELPVYFGGVTFYSIVNKENKNQIILFAALTLVSTMIPILLFTGLHKKLSQLDPYPDSDDESSDEDKKENNSIN